MTCASRHAMVVNGAGCGAGIGEVDRAVGVDGPAVRHRLPEVLVVGQAVQAWPQLVRPVEVELVGELVVRSWSSWS